MDKSKDSAFPIGMANEQDKQRKTVRVVQMQSRFTIKQVSETSFDVHIPTGDVELLNPKMVENLRLSDREIEDAEYEVLRSIAIIR